VARLPEIRLYEHSVILREAEWGATVDLIRSNPLFGIGPGHLLLRLHMPGLAQRGAYFTHNEYLQLAAEQGLFGLAVFLIGLAAVLMEVFQVRKRNEWLWTGAIAGLAALAVHSGFDFLWHIFVIPLVAVVTLAILCSRTWRTDIGGLAVGNASRQSG
jgi:O-antigen ligase